MQNTRTLLITDSQVDRCMHMHKFSYIQKGEREGEPASREAEKPEEARI